MQLRKLTILDIEYVAHSLARETMAWSEPIPDFSTRYTHSLERCVVGLHSNRLADDNCTRDFLKKPRYFFT